MSTMTTMLGWSVVLLLVHILAQTLSLVKDCGLGYAISSRDAGDPRVSELTKRLTRALGNFLETYAAFVGLALALHVLGKGGGMAATGAIVWFWARLVYVPVYAMGIAGARTAVWTVSVIGLLMMLFALWG